MAGGLGTRMQSAVPKHFHPILGRRMVDWIVDAGRDAGADPLVVVASPATRDQFADERRRRSPCRSSRSAPATPSARRAPRSQATTATCSILSGDTPLLTAELLRELVDDAPARRRRRDDPQRRAARPAPLRPHRARRRRHAC